MMMEKASPGIGPMFIRSKKEEEGSSMSTDRITMITEDWNKKMTRRWIKFGRT